MDEDSPAEVNADPAARDAGWRIRLAGHLRRSAERLDPSGVAAIPASSSWGRDVGFGSLLFRRGMIWLVSAGVAFYLPLRDAGLPVSLAAWQQTILADKKMSDVFLATVAMIVLSASDLIDNIISGRDGRADALSLGSAWTLIVCYFFFVFYGMPVFTSDPDPKVLANWWPAIWFMLGFSLVGEATIVNGSRR